METNTTTAVTDPATGRPFPQEVIDAYNARITGAGVAETSVALGFSPLSTTPAVVLRYGKAIGNPVPAKLHNRKFGVEIECHLPPQVAAEALQQAGVPTAGFLGYTHNVLDQWKVVTDATVAGGCEVVSPPLLGKKGQAEVKKVLKALRAAGATVSRSCGLHVHMDVNDFTGAEIALVIANYAALQDSIDTLVPASRRQSTWCRNWTSYEVERVANVLKNKKAARTTNVLRTSVDRYKTVNVHSFTAYGTLEFRQHQGTLNSQKTEMWLVLANALLSAAKSGHVAQAGDDVVDLVRTYGSDKAAAFFTARRQELA